MVTETSTVIRITQPVLGERGATPNGIEMTQCSQTHTVDAAKPNRLLTPRTTIKIGTWNVRTMFEAGKAQQIANEMSRYKISLLGISETRWTKSGSIWPNDTLFRLRGGPCKAHTRSRLYALSGNSQNIDGMGTG